MSVETLDTSSSDIVLPPGLILPGPDMPTDHFRRDVFNRPGHAQEVLQEFGAFVTALNIWNAADTGRISIMPKQKDILAVSSGGFGLTKQRLHESYGGERRLQAVTGFYPDGYEPPADEVIERLKWLASFFPYDATPDGDFKNIKNILHWASVRNLLPAPKKTYAILGPSTPSIIRRIMGIHKVNSKRDYTVRDTFKFGQKVIDKQDGTKHIRAMKELGGEIFIANPDSALYAHHKSLSLFWGEFDIFDRTKALSGSEIIALGVREAVKSNGRILTSTDIDNLSLQNRFPSRNPIVRRFDNITNYRNEVGTAYRAFRRVVGRLHSAGVTREVTYIAGIRFKAGDEFLHSLTANVELLKTLSACNPHMAYARRLITNGFDLRNDETYAMQLEDLDLAFRKQGINTDIDRRFLLGFMPRIGIDETLDALKIPQKLEAFPLFQQIV